jgi:hypothetical protein
LEDYPDVEDEGECVAGDVAAQGVVDYVAGCSCWGWEGVDIWWD